MSATDLPQEEKRLVELATGFALGELESSELEELYDRLRGSSEDAARAAGIVWETLGTSVDLRAVLGRHFQDTVQHRITDGGGPPGSENGGTPSPTGDRSRGFLSSLAARIGIARPSLDPVDLPEPRAPRVARLRRRALPGALLLVAVLVLCAVPFCGRRAAVRAAAVSGAVTLEGAAVTAGTPLPRSPAIVSEGATLLLEWADGHVALVHGPANVVPHESGLSLSSGTAWVAAAGSFTLGLPDGQAHCAVPAEFVAHIRENRTLLGVSRGNVRTTVRFQQGTLQAGRAVVLGGTPFDWRASLPWRDSTEGAPPGRTLRRLEAGEAPPVWRLAFTASWAAPRDEIVLRFPAGEERGEHRLVLRPGSVVLEPAGRARRTWELPGAPLLPRAVEIISPHAGRPVLRVEGLDEPVVLPVPAPPSVIEFGGPEALRGFAARGGPPPRPGSGAAGLP